MKTGFAILFLVFLCTFSASSEDKFDVVPNSEITFLFDAGCNKGTIADPVQLPSFQRNLITFIDFIHLNPSDTGLLESVDNTTYLQEFRTLKKKQYFIIPQLLSKFSYRLHSFHSKELPSLS